MRKKLQQARTADELRSAQSVVLPLVLGLSLSETAQAIGRSISATASMRAKLLAELKGKKVPPRRKEGLRNRALFTSSQEQDAALGIPSFHTLTGRELRPLIEEKLGRPLSLATVYRLRSRNRDAINVEDLLHGLVG